MRRSTFVSVQFHLRAPQCRLSHLLLRHKQIRALLLMKELYRHKRRPLSLRGGGRGGVLAILYWGRRIQYQSTQQKGVHPTNNDM